jgi:hypothetical protein
MGSYYGWNQTPAQPASGAHAAACLTHPAIVIAILIACALVSSVPGWIISYRWQAEERKSPLNPISLAALRSVRDFSESLLVDGPSFARHPKADFKSKLVLDLTNSGNKPVHFLEDISWTSQKGDVGLQSDVRSGYWLYPKGKSTWVDRFVDPTVEPNEKLHI